MNTVFSLSLYHKKSRYSSYKNISDIKSYDYNNEVKIIS